jgi:replicative DNA helicase
VNPANTQRLPQSEEAERAILGSAILADAAVIQLVEPEDFALPFNQAVCRMLRRRHSESKPINDLVLIQEQETAATLEACGGILYIDSIVNGRARVSNVQHFIAILRKKRKLREIMLHAANTLELCESGGSDDEIISRALAAAPPKELPGQNPTLYRSWDECANIAVDQLEYAFRNPDTAKRIRFGLEHLDMVQGGLKKSMLVQLVAPTGNGKTLLAGQLANQADADGFKVLIISAEMAGEDVVMRDIAYRANVPYFRTQQPELLSERDIARLKEVAKRRCGIEIAERNITAPKMWARIETLKSEKGLDLVIVDFDQLVFGAETTSEEDVFGKQRLFMHKAKEVAERLNICIVLLAQIRKLPPQVLKGARPSTDDLWGHASVRNLPQVILWLSREYCRTLERDLEDKAKIYILKNRSGRQGTVDLSFNPIRLRFENAASVTESESVEEERWQKENVFEREVSA